MSRTRIAAIFATALVSVLGATACGGGGAQQAEQLEQRVEQLEQQVEEQQQQIDEQRRLLNQQIKQIRETVEEEVQF